MKIRLQEAEVCRWRIMLQQQTCVENVAVIMISALERVGGKGQLQQHLPDAAPSLPAALCRLANVMSDEEKGKGERAVQPLNLSEVETSGGKDGGTALKVLIIHLEMLQPESSVFQVCACSSHFRKVGKVLLTRYCNS